MIFSALLKSLKNTGKLPGIVLCTIAFFITNWCAAQDISTIICPGQKPTFNAGRPVSWYRPGDHYTGLDQEKSTFTAPDTATLSYNPYYEYYDKDSDKYFRATAYLVKTPTAALNPLEGVCFSSPQPFTIDTVVNYPATYVGDDYGNALYCDRLANTGAALTTANIINNTDNFTMTAWIKWAGGGGTNMIFYNGNSAANGYGLFVDANTQRLAVIIGNVKNIPTLLNVPVNSWMHVALAREGGTWVIYVNSVRFSLNDKTNPNPPGVGFYIGKGTASSSMFGGSIDEVAVFNTPVSVYDIDQARADPKSFATHGRFSPAGLWRFEDAPSSTTVTDVTGRHNLSVAAMVVRGNVINYTWNFAGDVKQAGRSILYNFSTTGDKAVTLSVSNPIGCPANTTGKTVFVNNFMPPKPTASTTATGLVCPGQTINLSAQADIFLASAGFNNNGLDAGWTATNWSTFISTGNYHFFFPDNPDGRTDRIVAAVGATDASLVSPAFSTIGYNNIRISFESVVSRANSQGNVETVEASADSVHWTVIATYPKDYGDEDAVLDKVAVPAAFEGKPKVWVKFHWVDHRDIDQAAWIINYVEIYGGGAHPVFLWTSNNGTFSSNVQNPQKVVPGSTTTYSVVVNTGCISPSASVTVNAVTPTATITNPNNADNPVQVCYSGASPVVVKAINGTAPYTIGYTLSIGNIDGPLTMVTQPTASAGATLPLPEGAGRAVTYKVWSVTSSEGCKNDGITTIYSKIMFNKPSASIRGFSTCLNYSGNVVISPSGGQAPYTLGYKQPADVNTRYEQISSDYTITPPTATTGDYQYSLVNITDATGCAQNLSDVADVVINPVPDITFGTIPVVSTAAQTVTIPYTATTGSPNFYTIGAGGSNPMPGFARTPYLSISGGNIKLPIPASAVGTYSFLVYAWNTSTNCQSSGTPFSLVVGNGNNNLAGLTISTGTMSPGFTAGETSYQLNTLPATTPSVTVTPTAANTLATVKVNGVVVSSGSAVNIPLTGGANTITITVTAQDNTVKTYTITVQRRPNVDNLNVNGDAKVVYALRRLTSDYVHAAITPPAAVAGVTNSSTPFIRVRRSTDNALLDVGFIAGNGRSVLDTLTLKNFVGSGDGFVTTWYDLSGNNFDAVQTTAASQPRIITAGVIERQNGWPAVYFHGNNAYLSTAGFTAFGNGFSLFTAAAVKTDSKNTDNPLMAKAVGTSLAPAPWAITGASNFAVGNGSTASVVTMSTQFSQATPFGVWGFTAQNNGVANAYYNGNNIGNASNVTLADNGGSLLLGKSSTSTLNGWIAEAEAFAGVPDNTTTTNAAYNMLAYYSAALVSSFYPVTAGTGDTVVLTGNNFSNVNNVNITPPPGGTTVYPAFNIINSNTIKAVIDGGTSGRVYALTSYGNGWHDGFFFGKAPGNALSFDGLNDYVTINRPVSTTFTIEYWMNTTQTGRPGYGWYDGTGIVDAETNGILNDFGTSLLGNKLSFGIGTAGGQDKSIQSVSDVNTGRWVHVAAVRDAVNGTLKLYINGVLEATGTVGSQALTSPTTITLGALNTLVAGSYYKGEIDELKIYNTDRSTYIKQDMFMMGNPGDASLASYYSFDAGVAGSGNSGVLAVADLSPLQNDGTLYNFDKNGTSSNWVESYAMIVPVNQPAADTAATAFTASWSAPVVGSATTYLLDVSTDAGFSAFVDGYNAKIINGSDTLAAVTGLTPRTNYWYRVRANGANSMVAGQGDYSAAMQVKTLQPFIPVIYVDSTAGNDANNGTSWASAYKTVSYALSVAAGNTTVKNILVAKGTYYPAGTPEATAANGDSAFTILRNGIRLYGGYDAATGLRNINTNKTYLDGNKTSIHIVAIAGIGAGDSVIIDGVTIQRALVTGTGPGHTYNGVSFNWDEGAAAAIKNNSGLGRTLLFQNCAFINNQTSNNGAAVYISQSSPSFINCLFADNKGRSGTIFSYDHCGPLITNCTFANNTVSVDGGALTNLNVTAPVVNNSIIWLNGTSKGANNSSITNDGSSGITGAGNIIQGTASVSDPQFVNAAFSNYRLASLSPAINAGNNSLYGPSINTDVDLDGNVRLAASAIDIGAYETALPPTIYVDSAAGNNANNGDSWAKAFKTLSYALTQANTNASVKNILIAKGSYYPAGTAAATTANGDTAFAIVRNGIRLYGGYNATTGLRNIAANQVYLNGNNSSYHVLVVANIGLGDSVIVDGVTILNANCNGNALHMYNGVGFNGNEGGGVSAVGNNWLGNMLMFRSCAFINNNGNNHAAAFYNNQSSPSIVNCVFANNAAPNDGSAIFNWSNSKPIFINCTIANNTTTSSGGIMANAGASVPVFNNSIVWLNSPSTGLNTSAVSNDAGSGIDMSNSIIQGTTTAINPGFVNAPAGNYRLSYASRAVNAGSNALYAGDVTNDVDIAGNARLAGTAVDLGAYETALPSSTLYVDDAAGSDANDGSTWAKAFKTVSTALNAANISTAAYNIMVAKGTYYPAGNAAATTANADSAFIITHNGIRLYGGYDASTGLRNTAVNKTYLDGNNSSYHILAIAGIGAGDSVIIDGATIRNAKALGSGPLHIYNGIGFNSNEGGGVAAKNNNGLSGALLFRNCAFVNNYSDNDGGAFYNAQSSPSFVNCLFANNTGVNNGGAMFNYDVSNPVFTNSTIAYNVSAKGAAIDNFGNCTPVLNNSIVWLNGTAAGSNNTGITSNASPVATGANSIIQGGVGSNSTADPLFVNAAGGDYALQSSSPAINTGSNALYIGAINTDADLNGKARLAGDAIDMGAYECTASITWTGAASTDWNTATNWSPNTVPAAADDVSIPAAPANQPVLTTTAAVHSITLDGILKVDAGTLSIGGDVTSGGTFNAKAGSLILNGTDSQTVQGTILVNNLTINNTSTGHTACVNLYSGTTKVYGIYTPQAGVLTSSGHLVLASNVDGTATVANAGSNINYITGSVTVERYIPAKRAWRILTAPLSQTGTIFNNWQNGGVADGSTGAELFSPGGTGPTGNGLTKAGIAASISRYDSPTDNWIDLTNTRATSLGNNNNATANNAYAMFITGPYGSTHITKGEQATTLRATGLLQTGTQTFSFNNVAADKYVLVGNPYAAPINFTTITKNHVANTMWVWDAKLSGLGGYVMFSYDNATHSYDQDVTGTAQTTAIQSGQAFFVQPDGSSTTVGVTIKESDKTAANSNSDVFFTPTGNDAQQLRIALNKAGQIIDGILVKLGDDYNKDQSDDGNKLFGYNENISIKTGGNYLGIERMALPKENDSLWVNVWGMIPKTSYSFTITPQNIPVKIKAYLLDRFLHTKTQIALTNDSTLNFTTTADKASYADDRFVIVFAQAGALASTGTTIKAWQQETYVQVQWTTINEQDVQQYVAERSADGQHFTAIQNNIQPRNSSKRETYTVIDKQPLAGDNYYRIQLASNNGSITYSNVVKVSYARGKAAVSVYPNPVSRTEHLQVTLTNMDAGKYTIQLFSSDGKQVVQRSMQYDGSAATQAINLPVSIAAGSYRLILLDEKGNMWKQQVIIQ